MTRRTLPCFIIALFGIALCWAKDDDKEISYRGEVRTMAAPPSRVGNWTIGDRTVQVTAKTELDQKAGPIEVGSCVDVEGTENADKSIAASEIKARNGRGGCPKTPPGKAEEIDFRATIQSMTRVAGVDRWVVGGRDVEVPASAKVEPRGNAPEVGDCVDVEGEMRDGVVRASRIQRLGSGACGPPPAKRDEPRLIGLIESFPTTLVGEWRITGTPVKVTLDTRINVDRGVLAVGSCVEVRGTVSAGLLTAQWIEVLPRSECDRTADAKYEMYGIIESIPNTADRTGAWKISGRTVNVARTTTIDVSKGPAVVGACVEVRGALKFDGSLDASKIEVLSASGACLFRKGVVDAANFSSFAVSPGQIVSIFGMNLGPATDLPLVVTPDRQVTTELANVRVLFDNVEAPLLLASRDQINAVVPCSVTPGRNTTVQVITKGVWSNSVSLPVVAAWPSIFTLNGSGTGPAAVLNVTPNGLREINSRKDPAAPGSMIEVYATGLGVPNVLGCQAGRVMPLSPDVPRFSPVPSTISLSIGGVTVTPDYVGAVPGLVYGVFQINARVPSSLRADNDTPLTLKVGSAQSQSGVTIAVK